MELKLVASAEKFGSATETDSVFAPCSPHLLALPGVEKADQPVRMDVLTVFAEPVSLSGACQVPTRSILAKFLEK
jgi:hypothetical protein